MSDNRVKMELPCTVCGNAAAEITLPELGAVTRYALAKMLGARSGQVDTDSPTFGFSSLQIAVELKARCIVCVDAQAEDTSTLLETTNAR